MIRINLKKSLRRELKKMIDGQVVLKWILLGFLITCAIAAVISKRLITTVLVFMSYSIIMSVVWIILESPDLAGTEAAVGAGVTTILFFIVLKKIGVIFTSKEKKNENDEEKIEEKGEGNE